MVSTRLLCQNRSVQTTKGQEIVLRVLSEGCARRQQDRRARRRAEITPSTLPIPQPFRQKVWALARQATARTVLA